MCLLLLSALAGVSAGAAEDPDAGESTLTEYVEVRADGLPDSNAIATKLPTPIHRTPANVGTVGRALLEEQSSVVLGDALRNVSGVNVVAGPAVFDFFAVRGFDSVTGGLVLTDGAAEPEATFYPTYNLDGVEVLKGPGGFLYGSFGLAGTVNLVRKQPLATDFGSVSLQGGSFGTRQATVDWNTASSDGGDAFRVNALLRDTDGFRDGIDGRQAGINPAFRWGITGKTSLNLNLEYIETEARPDAGTPLLASPVDGSLSLTAVPRERSYQSPFDFNEQEMTRAQIDLEHRASERLTVRNKLYFRGLDWQSRGTLFNGTCPDAGGFCGAPAGGGNLVLRTLTGLDDRQDFLGNQLEAVYRGGEGRVRHELLVGLELGRYADDFTVEVAPPACVGAGDMSCIGLEQPMETQSTLPTLFPFESGDARSLVAAPYLVDQMTFSDRFQALVGLRYDHIDFEDERRDISTEEGNLSPMLGLLWAPDPSLSTYVNAGRSFAPASPRLAANELNTFEAEESTQVELGVKKRFLDGRFLANAAVFRIERDSLPIADSSGFTQQQGDQRSTGFELELAAQLRPRVRGVFSYAYVDAELTEFRAFDNFGGVVDYSGNRPAYAPEHVANLWLSKSFRSGFGLGAGGRHVAGQFYDEDNAFEIDAYTVFDAAAFYELDAWRFALNLRNLTDTEYETAAYESVSVIAAPGFAAYGSVEYRF